MSPLNVTTFAHAQVGTSILSAMQDAMNLGRAQYIENRKGEPWLRVALRRTDKHEVYFQMLDRKGREVGRLAQEAANRFWPSWAKAYFDRYMANAKYLELER